jgi:hypothetical protein
MEAEQRPSFGKDFRVCVEPGCRTLTHKQFKRCARHADAARDSERRLRSVESEQRVRPNDEKTQ